MISPCPLKDCPRECDIHQGETAGEAHLRGLAQGNNVLGWNKLIECYGEESKVAKRRDRGGLENNEQGRVKGYKRPVHTNSSWSVPLSGHALHLIAAINPVCSLHLQLYPWVEGPYCCWQANGIGGLGGRCFSIPTCETAGRVDYWSKPSTGESVGSRLHCETCLHMCVCVQKLMKASRASCWVG